MSDFQVFCLGVVAFFIVALVLTMSEGDAPSFGFMAFGMMFFGAAFVVVWAIFQ